MKNALRMLPVLLIGGLAAGEEQAPKPTAAEVAMPSEAELMKIERDAHSGLLLITALVADTPMRMILDTGATHTILHEGSVAKLKKNYFWIDTSHIIFEGNTQQKPKMLAAPLMAGPGISPRHALVVLNLGAVRSMMGEEIDGIIGMDILGSLPFTFNLKQNELYWGTPEGAVLTPLYGTMTRGGRMMVKAKCGSKEVEMLLDTGSAITRLKKGDWEAGVAGEIMAKMGNVNNTTQGKMLEGKPADIEVAEGVKLRNVAPLLEEPGAPVLLGLDALKEAVLIHLPAEDSDYGKFFMVP